MSKPKAPPAPDYAAAAQQTAAGNMENLQFQTNANRPDVITPFGSQTWASDPTGQYWTQTTNLRPDVQAALEAQQTVQRNQSDLAAGLQGQVAETMAGGFQGPNISDYIGNTPGISTDFAGFNPSGPGVDLNYKGFSTSQVPGVDLNAPQYSQANSDAGTKAAYSAATGLINPKLEQDSKSLDNQLRLQGHQPGTEAYDIAMGNLRRSQSEQLNNIADRSVLTGNEMANRDYASALAGYGAKNDAQGQTFSQGLQANQSEMQATGLRNEAQAQQYGQDLGTYQTTQDALANRNAASQQTFQQQMAEFNARYQDAFQQYYQPLNTMQAVLNGQQVQAPQFSNVPGSTAGYVGGADMLGAANMRGQYDSAMAATQASMFGSMMGAAGSLGGAAIGLSDERAKENIIRVGKTDDGHNIYKYNYKGQPGQTRMGVIAQEVAKKQPHAVVSSGLRMKNGSGRKGLLAVDYAQIH